MSFAVHPNRRWLLFVMWLACSILLSWTAFATLLRYSFGNDDASHILLIPFISGWLMFIDRRRIFTSPSSDVVTCLALLLPGIAVVVWSIRTQSPSSCAFGLVLVWIAGFALAFGREALKAARFPLMFLFLFIPLPEALLNRVVYFLQKGSTEISALLFDRRRCQFCERVSYSICRASVLRWRENAAASAPALLCWL